MNNIKTLAIAIVSILTISFLTSCEDEPTLREKVVGTWYVGDTIQMDSTSLILSVHEGAQKATLKSLKEGKIVSQNASICNFNDKDSVFSLQVDSLTYNCAFKNNRTKFMHIQLGQNAESVTAQKVADTFIGWCLDNLNKYWVVSLLMTIESSFIPFPSEIVVIPAAYLASASDVENATTTAPPSDLNIYLIILFGTLGSILGALINYGLSIWLGRPVIYKFANSRLGHMCLLSEEKVQKSEQYFEKHGAMGTFFGRLVPAVRQLISIPAGLSRMNIFKFICYTALGSALWNSILAALGVYLSTVVTWEELDQKIDEYSVPLKWTMIGLGAVIVLYLVWQGMKAPKQNKK